MNALLVRLIARVAIAMAVTVGVTSCGADFRTPEALGEAVAEAATDEDIDALKEFVCAKDRAELVQLLDINKSRKELHADDLEATIEFIKAQPEGKEVILMFKTTFENLPQRMTDMGMPTSTENSQTAIKEGDRWVMCN